MATEFFDKWLSFSSGKSIAEIEFFNPEKEKVIDLLGDAAAKKLSAFAEHGSGSLFAFYSDDGIASDEAPVAWLDSEGSPCIVVCHNFRQLLSLLPYGAGLIYTVAAVIENNLGADEQLFLQKAQNRLAKTSPELLADARERFPGLDELLDWLKENSIPVSTDPVKDIVSAHLANDGLTPWLAENLS